MPRSGKLLFALSAAPYLILAVAGQQKAPSYARDVAPVLKAHCATCHSGDDPAAGLDVTLPAGLKGVITPGKGRESVLVQRLKGIGGAQMPMGFAPLPDATIAKISAWVDAGATFDAPPAKHWAYVKPVKSTPPKLTFWVRNPIDAFVLARLRKEGFKPSPEAPKEVLLRRVFLDLIGIPPTPKQIDAFLADKRPDAYERVVDALLKNPHYGERQAMPWLDLSRYADSNGYEKDGLRTAWKYRDWLIDAFNRNMPYDEFTIEQLAGDLLPNPTLEQLVATGFNRNTMFNMEGGVDQAEAHYNVVLDRVGTTATVWLGSTMQCARCHDHKYDPFTQRDFYKLYAFFSNSVIIPRGPKEVGEEKWFESEIQVPTKWQSAEQKKLKLQVADLRKRMETWTPALQAEYDRWTKALGEPVTWIPIKPTSAKSAGGATLTVDADGTVTSSGKLPETDEYEIELKSPSEVKGIRIETLADPSLPAGGPGRAPNGNFVLSEVSASYSETLDRAGVQIRRTPTRAAADYEQREYEAFHLADKSPDFGWAVNDGSGKSHEVVLDLYAPAHVPVTLKLAQRYPGGKHLIGKLRISVTDQESPASTYANAEVKSWIGKPEFEKNLRARFLAVTPLLDETRRELASATKRLAEVEAAIPTALVMKDKPASAPLTTHLHVRGEFLNEGEVVEAGYPDVLCEDDPQASVGGSEAATNRLSLAKWIVDKDNPLTARVQVNRMWEQCFERGIVETSEDFGTQGSPPTHPELLDWLACKFMDSGWDMKAMMRLIVTSATYRQRSDGYPALMARDPQNKLLARGPRFRMDAELIRDTALAASGLLSSKLGGPSVYPYQPEGVWNSPYNGEVWMESKGDDRYRRGMYTLWKRTAPYPSFMSYDATTRESCTVRRIRTNTPLQALALMNDRAMVEAAGALASRMSREGGKTDSLRLVNGFRLCTGRRPSPQELGALTGLLMKLRGRYKSDPASAKKLAATADEAAWTMVGNVLLNLDATVTKS